MDAGCDIALMCNGTLAEKQAVAKAVPTLAGKPGERAAAAFGMLKAPDDASVEPLYDELAALLKPVLTS